MRIHPKRIVYLIFAVVLVIVYAALMTWSLQNNYAIPEENKKFLNNKKKGVNWFDENEHPPHLTVSFKNIWQVEIPEDDNKILHHKSPLPTHNSIPKLLHQIYADENIPKEYASYIKKCIKLNPDYKYVLWTDEDADKFMKDKYPLQYHGFYSYYSEDLSRNDAVRYFILYHYGGVYLDMDMDCIKPLSTSKSLQTSSCLIDQERVEQTMIVHKRNFSLMNSAMACRERHLFMRFLIANLQDNMDQELLNRAGPHFLTDHYTEYTKNAHAMKYNDYLKKKYGFDLKSCHNNASCDWETVKVAGPNMFSPHMDLVNRDLCAMYWRKQPQNSLRYIGCAAWQKANWQKGDISPYSVCSHQFLHLGHPWWREQKGGITSTVNMSDLLPRGKIMHRYSYGDTFLTPTTVRDKTSS